MKLPSKIAQAVRNTPYYSNMQTDISLVSEFPILCKNDVVINTDQFLCDSYRFLPKTFVRTSGSSGVPLQMPWNPIEYCGSLSELWKIRKQYGVSPADNYVSSHISLYNFDNNSTAKAVIQKNNLSLSKALVNEQTFLYYHKLIVDFSPKWMFMPPSFLYGFLLFLKERNLELPESIVLVELTGEYCSAKLFEWFETTYPNLTWKLMYGMQEFNGIAYGSPNGMKILDKNVYVEILDEYGTTLKPYEEGNIVISGLKNSAFPLIRYKSEDYGYFDSNGFLHITKARSNDFIRINDSIYDGAIFWNVILEINSKLDIKVFQFQVILQNNILYFKLRVANPDNLLIAHIVTFISNYLSATYCFEFEIDVQFVDEILPIQDKNKIKYFINQHQTLN